MLYSIITVIKSDFGRLV